MAQNMCKTFSLVLSKNLSPEKTGTNHMFTFQFLSDKINKCQMAFYGITVNSIIQKSKKAYERPGKQIF